MAASIRPLHDRVLITPEAVVAEMPEDKKKGAGPQMPGGDMDY